MAPGKSSLQSKAEINKGFFFVVQKLSFTALTLNGVMTNCNSIFKGDCHSKGKNHSMNTDRVITQSIV